MKIRTMVAGVGMMAAAALLVASCGKSSDEADKPRTTTAPLTMATRPGLDLQAIVDDLSAATQPEDDKSMPVGVVKKVTLPDGLIIEDLRIGKGAEVRKTARVAVNYTGWLDNKTIFDDSRTRGISGSAFLLGKKEVVAGWDEGIPGMKVGGVRLLTIPPALGYENQVHGTIPAGSTLHFRIQVLHIVQ